MSKKTVEVIEVITKKHYIEIDDNDLIDGETRAGHVAGAMDFVGADVICSKPKSIEHVFTIDGEIWD